MANDNQIQMEFLINDKSVKTQFAKIENKAKETSENIDKSANGNAFLNLSKSIKNVGSSLIGLVGPYAAVAAAVGVAVKQITDFVLAGEQATAINFQFKAAAQQAGLAYDQLSASIVKATDGLIDDDEALQLATKSIIALGKEAQKLPEILDLSRSISRSLGKDFKETFADLSQFLEAGNLKALRQYGIILDLDTAYKRAAQSIGVATSELTEQQKQAVRTSLVLDELPRKFNAAAQSVTPLSDALTRFWVETKNQFEDIGKSIAETLAQTLVDNADKSNVATARLSEQFKNANDEVSRLEKSLKTLNEERLGAKGASELARYALGISEVTKDLKLAREEQQKLLVELSGRSDAELFAGLDAARATPGAGPNLQITDEQLKAQKERALELTNFLKQQNVARLQADLEVVNQKDSINQQVTSLQLRAQQDLEVLKAQHELNLLNIEKQFSAEKLFTAEQANVAKNEVEKTYAAQREKIISDSAMKIAEIEVTQEERRLENVNRVAQAIQQTLLNSTASYLEELGASLVRGEDLFQNFGESVVAIMGDLAISIGKTLLFTGPAIEAFITAIKYLVPGSGLVAAAVGAGLILFGSALKASVGRGGGASTSAPSSGFAGGGAGSSPIGESELQQRGAQVQVNISGDVFDTEETGLRIVDILNKSFDQQGVTVRGMA